MQNKINNNRRRFLQQGSALGVAASLFPEMLLANSGSFKSLSSPNFKPDVEIEFTAHRASVPILNGDKTKVYQYIAKLLKGPKNTLQELPDNYLGPILNYVKGQKVRIYFNNGLDEPSIIHWHGLHVPQKSDGHPMYAIDPGKRFVYEFEVMNRAGTSFYHSHTHGKTATQVYKGLAGLITITDEVEQALELPRDEFDIPLVIQDRNFNNNNQLQYLRGMHGKMMGFLGETVLVNGKANQQIEVKTTAYRVRVLNGSNSRIYKLGWDDGTPLTAIGTDAGLLETPETRPYIMLAPAERIDLWIDFSGRKVGSKLIMRSLAYSGAMPAMYERGGKGGGMRMMGGMGMRKNEVGKHKQSSDGMMGMKSGGMRQGDNFPIVAFKVTEKMSDTIKLPKKLATIKRFTDKDVDNAHKPIPIALSMAPMSPQINGKSFSMDRVMDFEKVKVGSIKKLRIFHKHGGGGMMGRGMRGGMGMMLSMAHPIHLHGQQYQIVSRKMTSVIHGDYETVREGFIDTGWKDTVLVMPGEEIEIIKPFQDYKGFFLYHCHNLEHEDLGMMRQFYVG